MNCHPANDQAQLEQILESTKIINSLCFKKDFIVKVFSYSETT